MERVEPDLTTSPPAGGAVRLHALSKTYGETVAVAAVDLATVPGEFFTILGPSGSGKTTTLKMIAGFAPPSRGRIDVDGRDVTDLPPQAREIGMVFQNYALFPHLSVFENVAFPLRVRRVKADELRERVLAALEMVQLAGFEARLPHQLSGGQQQRVAFARAIVFRPRVLLLDEPLGALDRKLREHMQIEIKALQRKLRVTVIYITHDQEEALTMSDRIAVMNLGRVEQIGTPADLYERPANRFVASFLGESNFIDGKVAGRHDGEWRMRIDDGAEIGGSSPLDLADGERIAAAVRPEHVWLGDTAMPEHPNALAGTIGEVIYVGEAIRYRIRLAAGGELFAKLPRRFGERRFTQDERVVASWRPSDTTLFRET